jgi:hypothetical protein
MTRHTATPGELRSWSELLAPLAPDRGGAVKRLLSEVVADCARCDEPVRRCDPRRLVDGHLVHVACAPIPPDPSRASSPTTTTGGPP